MKVCKFGGSSLANASQIKKVCDIILADPDRKIMVVSAPGKRSSSDIKVTDLLIVLTQAILTGYDGKKELQTIIERYAEIARDLDLDDTIIQEITANISALTQQSTKNKKRFIDAMKAAGEDNCARLVAAYLQSLGCHATYLNPQDAGMILTSQFGNGQLLTSSYKKLSTLKNSKDIIVFPGFFGYNSKGETVTFSRGGSDITGSILAAAVDAEIYENWTDVDSVYSVSPKLVNNPHPIPEITYNEMRELAYAGFSVLHEEALVPVHQKGIPLNIKNTNNPKAKGTLVVSHRANFDGVVTGIAGAKGFCSLNIERYLMNREVGFALKILQILADENIPFEHIPSGIDSLSIVLKTENFKPEKEARVIKRIKSEIDIDKISVTHDLSIVMIVGEAMAAAVGVAARAATALSRAGVNLEIINQSISEISVMFGVKDEYCSYSVKELYKEFFLR